jgi:hypothetical protein
VQIDGIAVFTASPSVLVNNVVVRDCTFTGKGKIGTGFGLEIGAGVGAPNPSNVVATRCSGQNINAAFYNQTLGSPIILDHCIGQNCLTGFFNTSTHCQIINCCSEGNTVGFAAPTLALANSSFGDGVGFAGVDPILTKTGAAAVSNATYWNNVTF